MVPVIPLAALGAFVAFAFFSKNEDDVPLAGAELPDSDNPAPEPKKKARKKKAK